MGKKLFPSTRRHLYQGMYTQQSILRKCSVAATRIDKGKKRLACAP